MKKEDKLRAFWSKHDNDIVFYHPLGMGTNCDASFLYSVVLKKEILEELSARGYDVETLKFEICPKQGVTKFAAQRVSPLVRLAEQAE